jgi:hypothetical protein
MSARKPREGAAPGPVVMKRDSYTRSSSYDNFYVQKVPVLGSFVVILKGGMADRGLQLIPQRSRAVCASDIHELILSAETNIGPGTRVNTISYLGFLEISRGGVLLVGDEVRVDDRLIGHIAGYDYTHMPNHMNIVVAAAAARSGVDLGLTLGAAVAFVMPGAGPQ